MAQGTIAIEATHAALRRRPEGTLLVVGDARVRRLAYTARHRHGRHLRMFDLTAGSSATAPFDELLIDATHLEQVRQDHPELLRQAERIWVVPANEAAQAATADPFEHPLPLVGRVFKRALDVVLALAGLLLALPLLVVAMLAVRFDSPGPALFRQIRVGADGRRFRLYKLRTMRQGNDDRAHRAYVASLIQGAGERCGTVYKLTHDPRITSVGRVLRHYSIDELPQLWNVLKGDMSLVGPRPPLPHETELYTAGTWARMRVKPGVTGLWQVSGRCELTFEQMVSLDVRYWQGWTLRSDIGILLRTPRTVIRGKGAA